jgi:glycosyltransferase involved in cell wall biosynthesis
LKLAIYSVLRLNNGAGGERWIENIATQLQNKGVEVTVITTKYGRDNNLSIRNKLLNNNIRVLEFDNYESLVKIPKLRHIRKIAKLLGDTDVLYFNNAFALNEIIVYLLKRMTKVKVVSGYHGTFPETGSLARRAYHKLVNRTVCRGFDAHHVLNQERKALMLAWGYAHVYKIPNGVDTRQFIPSKKRNDTFTILFVGTMNYQKGIDRFANMVERINLMEPHQKGIRFIIIGSGKFSHIAETLQKKYANVSYYGYVGDHALAEAYSLSHVLIYPSRFDEFGIGILEANATGTPVIASNIAGPREIIVDGVNGFLMDSEVTDDLVEAALQLRNLWYNNPAEYQKCSENARLHALKYDWTRVANEIEEMLREIVKENP